MRDTRSFGFVIWKGSRALVWLRPLWSRYWYLVCGFVSLRQAIWRSFTRNSQEARPSRYSIRVPLPYINSLLLSSHFPFSIRILTNKYNFPLYLFLSYPTLHHLPRNLPVFLPKQLIPALFFSTMFNLIQSGLPVFQ